MPVTGQGRVMSYSHAAPPLSEAGVRRGRRAVSLGVLGVYDFQGQLMITDDKDVRAAYESSKIMDRLFHSVRCTTPKLEAPLQAVCSFGTVSVLVQVLFPPPCNLLPVSCAGVL